MALGPEIFNERFTEKIERIEQEIDRKLVGNSPTLEGILYIDAPRELDSLNFKIIKNKYLSAGWLDVEYHSDQRDGEWISFKLDKSKL
jgi:hypothetical protein